MKTKQQNKQEKQISSAPELQSRSEQLSGNNNSRTFRANTASTAETPTTQPDSLSSSGGEGQGEEARNRPVRPYVNFEERERNRQLPVERVLAVLKRWMPKQYNLAEVVGKWIWITFPEQPVERVRADLSQLGFHWNNTRKCWQHPCGQTLPRGQQNPREKYGSFMASAARTPADQAAA